MPRERARRGGRSSAEMVDLSKVEGRRPLPQEGDYLLAVFETTMEKGDAGPYISWIFEIKEDKDYGGAKIYYNTSLAENSLWNLRSILEALSVEIPEEAFDVKAAVEAGEYNDLEMEGTIEHETWEGRKRPRLVDFWPVEDAGASSKKEADTKRSDKSSGKGKAASKEPEVEVTEDEINDMSQDELESLNDEADLRLNFKEYRTLSKMKAAVLDAARDAGILEEGKAAGKDTKEKDEGTSRRSSRRR